MFAKFKIKNQRYDINIPCTRKALFIGATISDILGAGGGVEFLPRPISLFDKGNEEDYYFHSRIGGHIYFNIYILFISTSSLDNIFISTMP